MILIVEDDKIQADLLKEIIQDEFKAVEIVVIPNGKAAIPIARINKSKIKLIISDLNMPYMSGEEFVAIVKIEINQNIPIIMVSGEETGNDSKILTQMKNIFFLQKPYKRNELLSLVSNYI